MGNPATALSSLYSSQDEMDNLLSAAGLDLRLDDTIEITEIINESVSYATGTIDSYALQFYVETDMENSHWVRRRATIIACWYFSQRRGNPPLYEEMVNQIMEELKLIAQRKLIIPRLPGRFNRGPTVSNYVVDDLRHFQNKCRVQKSISTGDNYNGELIAAEPPTPFL